MDWLADCTSTTLLYLRHKYVQIGTYCYVVSRKSCLMYTIEHGDSNKQQYNNNNKKNVVIVRRRRHYTDGLIINNGFCNAG